jgi:hypothetical protein
MAIESPVWPKVSVDAGEVAVDVELDHDHALVAATAGALEVEGEREIVDLISLAARNPGLYAAPPTYRSGIPGSGDSGLRRQHTRLSAVIALCSSESPGGPTARHPNSAGVTNFVATPAHSRKPRSRPNPASRSRESSGEAAEKPPRRLREAATARHASAVGRTSYVVVRRPEAVARESGYSWDARASRRQAARTTRPARSGPGVSGSPRGLSA